MGQNLKRHNVGRVTCPYAYVCWPLVWVGCCALVPTMSLRGHVVSRTSQPSDVASHNLALCLDFNQTLRFPAVAEYEEAFGEVKMEDHDISLATRARLQNLRKA
eukprot:4059786-Amphidinium_carterae.1